ncbi:hypothetical protein ACFL2Q_01935 [Thermodesulfobacteriota bacterium]
MNKRFLARLKRHEIYVVAAVIGVVFVAAMALVAGMLRSSMVTPPYESLSDADLKQVFATGYLRFREEDGTPYLKVELHNGTMWWIKKIEFEFGGLRRSLTDPQAFRPLHFGALRLTLKKAPHTLLTREYDLKILKAFGYPPARSRPKRKSAKVVGKPWPIVYTNAQ